MKEINHEYYVSLEVAKLLKQAGFDWITEFGQHIGDGDIRLEHYINFNSEKYLVSLPTLDVAQKLLREVKRCIIYILPQSMSEYHCVLMRGHEDGVNYSIDWQEFDFPTYESALEAGIKKCLESILEKDDKD